MLRNAILMPPRDKNRGAVLIGSIYYVRPSGGTYGLEDGSSYANAWDGFSNIDWNMPSGSVLFVCGTHTETLTVGASNVTIRGDYTGDAGIITGSDLRSECLIVSSKSNVTINSISLIDATTSCLDLRTSTGIVTNNITASGSGNQGIQHQFSGDAIHNNPTCDDNVDDGISGHDACTFVVNGGTLSNNGQGVNTIGTVTSELNDIAFTGNIVDAQADSDSIMTLNRCFFSGTTTVVANSSEKTTVNNCVFTAGKATVSSIGSIEINNSAFWDGATFESNQTDTAKSVINRTFFDNDVNNKTTAINNGVYVANYCIYYNTTGSNIYAARSIGANISYLNNCTIVGDSNLGRGISAAGDIVATNTIFNDLNLGCNPNGAGVEVTFDYCNVFDVTTKNVNQNGGTFVETNPVTGDPLMSDVASLDFSLGVGSSCIGNGKTLTEATGIDTADWGDTTTVPVVNTKEQEGSWDIGAYIS